VAQFPQPLITVKDLLKLLGAKSSGAIKNTGRRNPEDGKVY